jgi:hypothetical protein
VHFQLVRRDRSDLIVLADGLLTHVWTVVRWQVFSQCDAPHPSPHLVIPLSRPLPPLCCTSPIQAARSLPHLNTDGFGTDANDGTRNDRTNAGYRGSSQVGKRQGRASLIESG